VGVRPGAGRGGAGGVGCKGGPSQMCPSVRAISRLQTASACDATRAWALTRLPRGSQMAEDAWHGSIHTDGHLADQTIWTNRVSSAPEFCGKMSDADRASARLARRGGRRGPPADTATSGTSFSFSFCSREIHDLILWCGQNEGEVANRCRRVEQHILMSELSGSLSAVVRLASDDAEHEESSRSVIHL
jgi:hypothetical protein